MGRKIFQTTSFLLSGRVITADELVAAARTAHVPEEYRAIFTQARDRIVAVAAEVGTA